MWRVVASALSGPPRADGEQIEESEDFEELQLALHDPTRLAAGAVSTITLDTDLEIRAGNKPTARKEM